MVTRFVPFINSPYGRGARDNTDETEQREVKYGFCDNGNELSRLLESTETKSHYKETCDHEWLICGLLLILNEGSDPWPFHFDLGQEECLTPLFKFADANWLLQPLV